MASRRLPPPLAPETLPTRPFLRAPPVRPTTHRRIAERTNSVPGTKHAGRQRSASCRKRGTSCDERSAPCRQRGTALPPQFTPRNFHPWSVLLRRTPATRSGIRNTNNSSKSWSRNRTQERQKLQAQQEKEHQQLAKQNANDARKQQTEQKHQQQTQQLQQRHTQQQQICSSGKCRQAGLRPRHPRGNS